MPPPLLPVRWSCPACAAMEKLQRTVDKEPGDKPPGQSVAMLPRKIVEDIEATW